MAEKGDHARRDETNGLQQTCGLCLVGYTVE